MKKKISQILKESTIPQINGELIGYTDLNQDTIGKCALGVLACESGNPDLTLDENTTQLKQMRITNSILKEYDIPSEYLNRHNAVLPELYSYDISDDEKHINWTWENSTTLEYIIMSLNDKLELSFKEIGEFLEVTFDL